jgi:hypothetical protein
VGSQYDAASGAETIAVVIFTSFFEDLKHNLVKIVMFYTLHTTLEKTWVFRRQTLDPAVLEISEMFSRDMMVGVLIKTFLAAREIPLEVQKIAHKCSAKNIPQGGPTSMLGKRSILIYAWWLI